MADLALETLLLPFANGELAWPDGEILFLRAREGFSLRRFALERLVCEQSYKPDADALMRSGLDVAGHVDDARRFELVLVLPPRSREEARALFARAVQFATPGGRIVACIANEEGAKSGEKDLQQIAGLGGKLTKNHCRVFWTNPLDGSHDATVFHRWLQLDALRTISNDAIVGGEFYSRPGIFAWDRIDAASRLLAENLPNDLRGTGADLGAGLGFLAAQTLARNPNVAALHLYEAEARALQSAQRNLATFEQKIELHWHDVTAGLPGQYDFIVTNPPFHALQKTGRPDIGQQFIRVAATALNANGRLWLVANRHLPYEQVLGEKFATMRVLAERDGFKAIEAVKA